MGVKSGILLHPSRGTFRKRPEFGEFYDHSIEGSYDPQPKRERMTADYHLEPWESVIGRSLPYSKGVSDSSPLGEALECERQSLDDQPDGIDPTFGESE